MKAVPLLFALFIVLLHVVGAMFSLHDRNMRRFQSETFADAEGAKVHYYELRQANARWNIVFVHGTPATAAVFGEQFRKPYPQANLFALDRPGFGASASGVRRPRLEEQADAVHAVLMRLPGEKTILVGHSYGAPVAVATALKYPDEVTGLLLIGGSIDPAQEHIYCIQTVADWPIISWVIPRSLRQCNRELLTLRGDLIGMKTNLSSLSVPVVMLHGTEDRQVPIANVKYLQAQLAAAGKSNLFDSMVMPGYNHFIPWEHPEAVTEALQRLTSHIGDGEIR